MKKNILVLNYEFPPLWWWWSPVSYQISKWYLQMWHNVDVVTMSFKWLKDFEVLDWMNIYRVKCLRTKQYVCHPWEQLTYLYFAYKKVKELIKTKKYDICHAHFIIPTWVLALKLKKEFWLPYILTAHWSDVLWHNPRFSLLYKFLKSSWVNIVNNAQKVISPSRFLQENIFNYTKEGNLEIIPNWIEKNKFSPWEKQKYILVVSRLQKSKAIQDLIYAIKDVDLKDWKIKIVWEGPYKETLLALVKEFNLENKIEFLWWIDNNSSELKKLYSNASIFCQPSLFESFWLTILEAMQSWCLIIARDIWGNKWIMSETPNFVFNDIQELSDTLKKILDNEEIFNSVWDFNTQYVKNFEWDNILQKYQKEIL